MIGAPAPVAPAPVVAPKTAAAPPPRPPVDAPRAKPERAPAVGPPVVAPPPAPAPRVPIAMKEPAAGSLDLAIALALGDEPVTTAASRECRRRPTRRRCRRRSRISPWRTSPRCAARCWRFAGVKLRRAGSRSRCRRSSRCAGWPSEVGHDVLVGALDVFLAACKRRSSPDSLPRVTGAVPRCAAGRVRAAVRLLAKRVRGRRRAGSPRAARRSRAAGTGRGPRVADDRQDDGRRARPAGAALRRARRRDRRRHGDPR